MSTPAKAAPTPAQVEALALEYHNLEEKIAGLEKKAKDDLAPHKKRLDELWDELVPQVKDFGSAHGEKSKLLHGLQWEVMGTFGSTTVIDGAAVETFRVAMLAEKKSASKIVKRIFSKAIRWTLADTAGAFLRAEHEAGKFPDRLYALFARCSVPKELTPKLAVRPKSA